MEEKWEDFMWFDTCSYSQDETTNELQNIKRSSTKDKNIWAYSFLLWVSNDPINFKR